MGFLLVTRREHCFIIIATDYLIKFTEVRALKTLVSYSELKVVSVRSAMVSRFCVRPTSKMWFLKIVQVTKIHDPIDAAQKSV